MVVVVAAACGTKKEDEPVRLSAAVVCKNRVETSENHELLFLGSSNLRLCQIFIFMSRLPRDFLHTMPDRVETDPKYRFSTIVCILRAGRPNQKLK